MENDPKHQTKIEGRIRSNGCCDHKPPSATILVVDDEQGILDTYQHYLSPAAPEGVIKSARRKKESSENNAGSPYRLLLADTGERAIELVAGESKEGRRVQVGFFDMKIPGGLDGLETIRQIISIDPDIYCIIVTAYQDRTLDEISKVFGEESFDRWDYLNKPFTANEIVQKARNASVSWIKRRENESRIRAINEANSSLEEAVTKRNEGLAIATSELKEKRARLEKAIKEINALKSDLKQRED